MLDVFDWTIGEDLYIMPRGYFLPGNMIEQEDMSREGAYVSCFMLRKGCSSV